MKQYFSSIISTSKKTACSHTWLEIDRAALMHNLHVAKKWVPHADIIAVLKANAYGHGMEEVAKTLAPHVAYFAVASCEEALRLQRAVAKVPIMLLSAALPCEYPIIAKNKLIPTISSFEEAKAFTAVAPMGAPIHVMINTGMGRLGVDENQAVQVVRKIAKLPLTIQSFSTHLPSADDDKRGTRVQLAVFKKIASQLQKIAPRAEIHALNSAGVLRFSKELYPFNGMNSGEIRPSAEPPESSAEGQCLKKKSTNMMNGYQEAHGAARIGLMLYGISPIPSFQKLLIPVMTWKARVALVYKLPKGATVSYGKTFKAPRELVVAVLPAGYADGYPWQLSNKGVYVLINGRRCPLLGRVTMDQIVVDISRAGKVSVGSEAVLLGRQKDQEISATWLAAKAGTIPWHLLTGIGERVQRC